jgi:hypothetical protein
MEKYRATVVKNEKSNNKRDETLETLLMSIMNQQNNDSKKDSKKGSKKETRKDQKITVNERDTIDTTDAVNVTDINVTDINVDVTAEECDKLTKIENNTINDTKNSKVETADQSIENAADISDIKQIDEEKNIEKSNISDDSNNKELKKDMTSIIKQTVQDEQKQYLSLDQLIINLQFLSTGVPKDTKLTSNSGILAIDNMWFGTVTRLVFGEGRETTYAALSNILDSSNHHSTALINKLRSIDRKDNKEEYEDTKRSLDNITLHIGASVNGVYNLLITYQDDEIYQAKLKEYIRDLLTRTNKNLNYRDYIGLNGGGDSEECVNSATDAVVDDSEETYTIDELKNVLQFLATGVQKNTKLIASSADVGVDKMWFGTVSRWYYGEGRESTYKELSKISRSVDKNSIELINKLRSMKNKSSEEYSDIKSQLDDMTIHTGSSINGIFNLIITYKDDDNYLGKLKECIKKLLTRAYKNMNYYDYVPAK